MAIRHAMAQRPDLALIGGDLVTESNAQTEARTRLQWDLYRAALRECTVPAYHAIGNHDAWGWNKAKSGTTGEEPLWGKRWFLEEFGQAKTYRSFDHGAWHFAIVDTLRYVPEGVDGFLDDEGMDWLKADLAATRQPTLVMSPIPILSATPLAGGYDALAGSWKVDGHLMTRSSDAIRALFAANRHVKVALSGHTHLLDRVDYDGVPYLCGGGSVRRLVEGAARAVSAGLPGAGPAR